MQVCGRAMRGEYWENLRYGVILITVVITFMIFDRADISLAVVVGFGLICGCKILTDYQREKKVKS